jgi:hypothetical protein
MSADFVAITKSGLQMICLQLWNIHSRHVVAIGILSSMQGLQRSNKMTEISMDTVIRVNSQLNYKRIAAYFKRCGVEVHAERRENGDFFLANGFCMVWVPQHPDLPYTFFDETWKRATFSDGKGPATENYRPDQGQYWTRHESAEYHPLTLTHQLHEVPGDKKGGELWRKFTFEDTQLVGRESYFNKQIMDMFSPDLDELQRFYFEQIGHHGPMRVSASCGHVAIVMPGNNIANR